MAESYITLDNFPLHEKEAEYKKEYMREYYQKNKLKMNQKCREYREKHKMELSKYGKKYRQKHGKELNRQTLEWKHKNPERTKELNKNSRERIKSKVFELLGNKCIKCGFSDWRALQIDHINGSKIPHKNRGKFKDVGLNLCSAILRGERKLSEFQLLCANCNWIKRFELNEHNGVTKHG